MNKALNKYGKAKWGATRLSRPHKARESLRIIRMISALSVGNARMNSIASALAKTDTDKINKKMAIAECIVSTTTLAKSILSGEL